jgi:hypothetical protein
MPKVSIATEDTAPVVPPPEQASGEVQSQAYFSGDRQPLHLHLHRLAPNASIPFTADSADQVVYVWKGSVEAGGVLLNERSMAIVEHGAALATTATGEGATLLVFNARERSDDDRPGGHVHILPSDRVPRLETESRVGLALYADSQCETCKAWLHENEYANPNIETKLHSHSEDEIIFVRGGSIRLGNRVFGPGMAVAVAANTKYGFFSGEDGLSFVNFRGTSPTYTSADGSTVLDEAAFWRSRVGIPTYLEPA